MLERVIIVSEDIEFDGIVVDQIVVGLEAMFTNNVAPEAQRWRVYWSMLVKRDPRDFVIVPRAHGLLRPEAERFAHMLAGFFRQYHTVNNLQYYRDKKAEHGEKRVEERADA